MSPPLQQFDMFEDAPVVPGFAYSGQFITPHEEAALIARIGAEVDLTPFRFQGWFGKRLTATFGWRYVFDDPSLARAEPLPDWLLPFRDRAAAFAGLDPEE